MQFSFLVPLVFSILTIAAGLSVSAILVGYLTRRRWPAIENACWLIVFFRLVIPPFIDVPVPGFPTAMEQAEVTASAVPETKPSLLSSSNENRDSEPETSARSQHLRSLETIPADHYIHNSDTPPESSAATDVAEPQLQTGPTENAAEIVVVESSGTTGRSPAADRENATVRRNKPAQTSAFSIRRVIGFVWLGGSAIVLMMLLRSMFSFARLMRLSEPAGEEFLTIATATARTVGLKKLPGIRLLAAKIPPLVWTRPGRTIVVFPRELTEEQHCDCQDLLLAHEFHHIRRRDHWVRWLEFVAMILWWWCPLFWLARSRLQFTEELDCDKRVLKNWPQRAQEYARVIVQTARFVADSDIHPRLATGGTGAMRCLKDRIDSINQQTSVSNRTGTAAVVGLLAIGLLTTPFLLVAPSQTQTTAPENPVDAEDETRPENAVATQETKPATRRKATDAPNQSRDDRRNRTLSTTEVRKLLPRECHPSRGEFSPDRTKIAWCGRMTDAKNRLNYGLYVFDVASRKSRLLVEKLNPRGFGLMGWSLDGTRLAVGSRSEKLAIIEVATSQREDVDVYGAAPDWSPNGRFVAVGTIRPQLRFDLLATDTQTVKTDPTQNVGRIAVWDTRDKKLTYVTEPGIDHQTKFQTFRSNAMRPVWSPNGQWIAWLQRIQIGRNDYRDEIWVARPNGTERRRAFKNGYHVRWSDDSQSLAHPETQEFVSLSKMDTRAKWPAPAKLSAATKNQLEKHAPNKVFAANKAWLQPNREAIESVEMTHRSFDPKVDERFVWRSDGANLVEVIHRDDKVRELSQGWQQLRSANGECFTYSGRDQFPEFRAPIAVRSNRYLFPNGVPSKDPSSDTLFEMQNDVERWLRGVRLNCVTLDWGQHAESFVVKPIANEENGTAELEIRATRPINIGTRLEVPNPSSVSDVYYNRAVLTVDEKHRIVRERSFGGDTLVADIRFSDWITTPDGSVPRQLKAHLPQKKFHYEAAFQTVNRLWILKSGTAWFEGQPKRRHEIVDVKFNSPEQELKTRLSAARAALKKQSGLDAKAESQPVRLRGLTPFTIGKVHQFPPNSRPDTGPASLTFMPFNAAGDSDPMLGPFGRLTAELNFSTAKEATTRQTLVLYDSACMPIHALFISPQAAVANENEAARAIEPLLNKLKLWLTNSEENPPPLQYKYLSTHRRFSQDYHPRSNRDLRFPTSYGNVSLPPSVVEQSRGIPVFLALDSISRTLRDWCLPFVFDARWKGKDVQVLGLTGRRFPHQTSLNLGATSEKMRIHPSVVMLVVDRKTGLPLVERSRDVEIQFLDYVEASPGQYFPLRLLCRDGANEHDLRFQVLNGKYWLFDHRFVDGKAAPEPRLDDIQVDDKPPISRRVSSAGEDGNADSVVHWDQLTNRVPVRKDDRFSKQIAAFTQPWRHPIWSSLSHQSSENTKQGQVVRCEIQSSMRYWDTLADVRYWTLTQHRGNQAQAMICPESLQQPPSFDGAIFAMANDRRLPKTPVGETDQRTIATTHSPKLHNARYSLKRAGAHTVVIPEVYSEFFNHFHRCAVTAVAVHQNVVVSAGWDQHIFHTQRSPNSSKRPLVLVGNIPANNSALMIGRQSVSTQDSILSSSTNVAIFDTGTLLNSDNAVAREAGLLFLHNYRRQSLQHIANYEAEISRILKVHDKQTQTALIAACCLAGYLENDEFRPVLRPLLKHKSTKVRDAAVVGLGMLKVRTRIDQINNLASVDNEQPPNVLDWRIQDGARQALKRMGESAPGP